MMLLVSVVYQYYKSMYECNTNFPIIDISPHFIYQIVSQTISTNFHIFYLRYASDLIVITDKTQQFNRSFL